MHAFLKCKHQGVTITIQDEIIKILSKVRLSVNINTNYQIIEIVLVRCQGHADTVNGDISALQTIPNQGTKLVLVLSPWPVILNAET